MKQATIDPAADRASAPGAFCLETTGVAIALGERTFCRDFALAVRPGECCVVIGPNGAGKSTLLRTLAGLLPPRAGTVRYGGDDIAELSARERARRRAWLAQSDQDAFPATVLQTVLAGRHPHRASWTWESAEDLAIAHANLRAVDLEGFADRDVATLSGGERRRAALAAVLTQQASLLLLDEPTTHLDLHHQITLLDLLTASARTNGAALVMVLHDIHLALRYASTAVTIARGGASVGRAQDVLTRERLSALFEQPLLEVGDNGRRTFLPA